MFASSAYESIVPASVTESIGASTFRNQGLFQWINSQSLLRRPPAILDVPSVVNIIQCQQYGKQQVKETILLKSKLNTI
jgi:hypothetical protein